MSYIELFILHESDFSTQRYNSDSDNEDVKSDVSDGMDYAPTAYVSTSPLINTLVSIVWEPLRKKLLRFWFFCFF